MKSVTILAVDDQPLNLDLVELSFIEKEHVKIIRATSGEDALGVLEKEIKPDVILLDLAMPAMDGFEVLKIIKSDGRWNTIPVIVLTANAEEKQRALRKGASDFLSKPYDIEELQLRTLNYAKIKHYQDHLAESNAYLEERVQERTAELEKALLQAKKTEYEISARLGKASEYRDLETGMHIKRMSYYSAKLAELAGLDEEEIELVLYASPLHDIGKVGIPDHILLKPGRFTPEEFEIMKLHAVLGGKMLEGGEEYPVIRAGRTIALQHHEKYDGSGYPKGLKKEEIHIHARIVAIADVFDALSSERVYKKAFSIEETMRMMKEGSGSHFDPALIALLEENLDLFLEIRAKFPDEEGGYSILDIMGQLQETDKNHQKILIAEDEEYNQMVLEGMIEILYPSWQVELASNGVEALEKLDKEDFDLLLCDVDMPTMNGYELIDELKKRELKIPKICITASAISGDREKLLAYGFDSYISKPVDMDELKQVLGSYLNR